MVRKKIIAAAIAPALFSTYINAQETESFALEEVIVTAQKRATSLQDTPISITAFDTAALEAAGIEGVTEVALRTPGLSVGTFNLGQPQIYIRGIGSNEDSPGGDPSVVVFLDEVYLGRPAASAFDLYDLERVEVLRGPQGTLFGKNASGGAISITTRKPTQEFIARGQVGFGNLDSRVLRGYVSGGLTETLAGSVSISSSERDGFVRSVVTGSDLQDRDSLSGRAALRYTPSETLEANFSLDFSTDDGFSTGRKLLGGPGTIDDAVEAAFPGINANPFLTASSEDGLEERDLFGLSANIKWQTSIGELTSVTAYRESEFLQETNLTGNSVGQGLFILNFVDEDSDQFSQELRLSNTGEGLVKNWVAGLFYLEENATRREDFPLFAFPASFVILDNETTSIGAFADVNLGLTDKLQLSLGARYTDDDKDYQAQGVTASVVSGILGTPGFVAEDFSGSESASFSETTYRVLLDYKPNDNLLLYLNYSTGFKSGGFQGQPTTAVAALTPFDPETADSFEVGLKASLLQNRLQINTSLFSADYDDYQELVTITNPATGLPTTITTNAAQVSSEGFELEIAWLPLENLQISASLSLLDAVYDEYIGFPERIGNATRNAPDESYSLAVAYSIPFSDVSGLDLRADYRFQSIAFQDPDNLDFAAIPEFDLIDASITYRVNERLEFRLWGKNLADEEYLVHNFPLAGQGATITGLPRTFGVQASWSY